MEKLSPAKLPPACFFFWFFLCLPFMVVKDFYRDKCKEYRTLHIMNFISLQLAKVLAVADWWGAGEEEGECICEWGVAILIAR